VKEALQDVAMALADLAVAALPRPVPPADALRRCKLISHRGEHDNREVFENTLPAFEAARRAGVWGLECDIRWSADLVPLVSHDADGRRLFGRPEPLADLPFDQIRENLPRVPSLAEFIAEFGTRVHLMLEIKAEHYPEPRRQKRILREHLAGLAPGRDYHFLALNPELFERVDFLPREYCFPVAQTDVNRFSRISIEAGYGGITGHYLLLTKTVQSRQESAGQRIGTGFINSRNCLYRELNRGIEWIFSNRAVAMRKILDELLMP